MKNFSFTNHLNKVWMLALVAFMVACAQFEAQGPDDVNLENAEGIAALNEISGMWNARMKCDGPLVEPRTGLPGRGGNVECSVAGKYSNTSGRIDYDWIDPNDKSLGKEFKGTFPEGFTIYTDGTKVFWKFEPFEDEHGVLQCLANMSVIVKGGPAANVYDYDGETEDCGLVSPNNASGKPAGLSNLTFCYNLEPCPDQPEDCWKDETALSDGIKFPVHPWFTYTQYDNVSKTVDLIAGQNYKIGEVTFAPEGGKVRITIQLNDTGAFQNVNENVKIQGWEEAPKAGDIGINPVGLPAFGEFETDKADASGDFYSVLVDKFNFYCVHVDGARKIECPL